MIYRLGIGIAQILPFIRNQPVIQKEKSIITNKLIIIMAIVAIVKIAVLILWI